MISARLRTFVATVALVGLAGPDPASAQSAAGKSRGAPVLTGIFPPSVTAGETNEWTLTGRGLRNVKQLVVEGQGIEILGLEVRDDTRLTARLRAIPGAPIGFRSARVEGANGVSNPSLFRVDSIPQAVEVEPNDDPASAQGVRVGSAVAGILRDTDLDHFRVEGPPGETVTVDFEARRLGTAITPVLTILNRRGASIAQARESRSSDHDVELPVRIPKEGVFVIQVRDNTYGGNETAVYRLRVTRAPFATAIFPLGGAAGKPLEVTASGGSLARPVSKTIQLPGLPGTRVEPGEFHTAEGDFLVPMTLIVGDATEELMEVITGSGTLTTPIRLDQTANGRIGRPGEVDRYSISVRKGEKFRIQILADSLGSWLDSFVSVRNKAGEAVAENDDDDSGSNQAGNQRGVNVLGLSGTNADSRIDFEAAEDGPMTIEVTDRYGDGGPAFGYRLSVGLTRPDVALGLLLGNPNASGEMASGAFNQSVRLTPGTFGAFNVAPGMKIPINFTILPEGRPGPVTVSVEGLPDGVTSEPVRVELPGPGPAGSKPDQKNAPARADNLVLNVAPYAVPGLSTIRLVATFEPVPGARVRRVGTAMIGLNTAVTAVPARPITRRIESLALRVVGESRPRLVGPPEQPRLLEILVPAPLLQGDRIDLRLDFDTSPLGDPGFQFEAVAKGVGLSTNTVIATGMSDDDDRESPADILVRILASPKAPSGVYPVEIKYATTGGAAIVRVAHVIVRQPVEVLCRAEPIPISPGTTRPCWVAIRRESGADVEVDLRVDGLPRGVRLVEPVTLKPGESEATLRLEMATDARPISRPTTIRVVAIARMPRGAVTVESRFRPILVAPPSE